ncbi:MAG: hypothetical protein ACI837_001852 [Crocinitomicaceae bacterium]|jgi:hypothetical protein
MRLLTYSTIFLLFGLISACTTDEAPVLDMNDILPESKGNYDYVDSTNSDSNQDSLKLFRTQFSPLLIDFDTIRHVNSRLIVDRFGHEKVDKFELIGGEQILHCYTWIYSDSSRVINALYNWIDCFGDDCKSTVVGGEDNLQKNAFHIYANDTALIYLESDHAIKTSLFTKYLESQGYDEDWNYCIEQTRGGKARWYKFDGKRKVTIKME